jgi:hypothetical protein
LAVQELQWRDKFVGEVQREVGQIGEERHNWLMCGANLYWLDVDDIQKQLFR